MLDELHADIERALLRDQHRLRRELHAIRKRMGEGKPADRALARLNAELDRSIAQRRVRAERVVQPAYPADLPIAQRRAEIAAAIAAHQVIVVCGETGSGKTTQLPKICLELGRGVAGMIGHTQPRRIAARSVAARIADELDTRLGEIVGYKVRFTDESSPTTLVKVMTDGILLAETQGDRFLTQYDTLIIDEAHERSLNIDFLLGYLKQLLSKPGGRPDLKVIITSATIDPQRFSEHFDGAPIIEVSGRTYPVELRYRPAASDEPDEDDPTMLEAIGRAVDELIAGDAERGAAGVGEVGGGGGGDILIFLSGEREIRETKEALSRRLPPQTDLLPLYARLSADEQHRVFQPHAGRRIVLATNVAETSLTVPGIRAVIDPGLARISRYSSNARVQRLPIERISQASAEQRKGRCGRIGPGVCIRLYSEDDYASRPEFTEPEIRRSNLASVILQMKALRLGAIEEFPFIDAPRPGMIREGYQTLHELGAVDEEGELTAIGAELARLPVDPRIGRMILAARENGSLHEVLIIASALSVQDPRIRTLENAAAADVAHRIFSDERSDFLAYVKLWDFYHERAGQLSSRKLWKLCREHHLSYVRLREWHDVHRQLSVLVRAARMPVNREPASYSAIHRALLAGLISNVGVKGEGPEYHGVKDRRFLIFPGSGLFKKDVRWIMAAELVETTRLFARTAARIQPEWIEPLAAHLVKRTHTPPHWNRRSAHVEAYERVTLQGLTIIPRRRVHFGKIDPELARETFIRNALVEGEYELPRGGQPEFLEHNRALVQEIRVLEAKRRRRDIMVEHEALYSFYDSRVPTGIFNGPLFEKWRRQAERGSPKALFMSREELLRHGAADVSEEAFPDSLQVTGVALPLEYRHEPGHVADGVTATVPLEMLNQLREERTDWLVPGMLREKIIALIKTLPKELRTSFVPAPTHAEAAEAMLRFGRGPLLDALSAALEQRTGIAVPHDAWRPEQVPDPLRMNFRIMGAAEEMVAEGRDLNALRARFGAQAAETLATSLANGFARRGITQWDFGDLPERVELDRAGVRIPGWPAIVDESNSVALRLIDSRAAAEHLTRGGLRRLFLIEVSETLAMHVEYLPRLDEMIARFAPLGPAEELQSDLMALIADRAFLRDAAPLRTANDFERRLGAGWDQLWTVSAGVSELVAKVLESFESIDVKVSGAEENSFFEAAARDMRAQLNHLFRQHFLIRTPFEWLLQYPRFLQAIAVRLQKLTNAGLARDAQAMEIVREFWTRYAEEAQRQRTRGGVYDPRLEEFRWLIEELRVSLFAQELGTSAPVSPQRVQKLWARLRLGAGEREATDLADVSR